MKIAPTALTVDGTDGIEEGISVFQRNVGNAVGARGVGVEGEHDAAAGADLLQLGHQFALAGLRCGDAGHILRGGDRRGGQRQIAALHLQNHGVDGLIHAALLEHAGGFAGKDGAVEIGIRRQAAGALHQRAERLAGQHAVGSGVEELALEAHQGGLLGDGNVNVGLRKDGDHVARLQFEVLRCIVLQDQLCRDRTGSGWS